MGDITSNIAIQLVLQKCCKTSCMFFCCPFFRTFKYNPEEDRPVVSAGKLTSVSSLNGSGQFCIKKRLNLGIPAAL